jgi:hypothetical protein
VVLTDSSVSAYHARLIINGDSMIIEDLGSTNGTAISSEGRKIARALLAQDDVVYFGSAAVSASELVSPKVATTAIISEGVVPEIRAAFERWWAASAPVWRHARTAQAIWFYSAALLLVTVGLVAVVTRSGKKDPHPRVVDVSGDPPVRKSAGASVTRPESDQIATAAQMPSVSSERNGNPKVAGSDDRKSLVVTREAAESTPVGPPLDTSKDSDHSVALFSVLVSDDNDSQVYRLGTAWAAGTKHLVTSASIVVAMERLHDEFPQSSVYCPALQRRFAVAGQTVHPEYRRAVEAADEARGNYDNGLQQLQAGDADVDARTHWEQRLKEYFHQYFEASERQAHYDIGVLEISEPLDTWLTVDAVGDGLRPKTPVRVSGLPFDREDPYFDAEAVSAPSDLVGRVHRLAGLGGSGQRPFRLLVECGAHQLDRNWTGSPVFDEDNRVIAVYSRPKPSTDPSKPPPGDLFDAALGAVLHDFSPLDLTTRGQTHDHNRRD